MIFAIVGTRPEVVKMAPVVAALKRRQIPVQVVATGQHYNWQMMGSFLESFRLEVDHQLELGNRDLMGSFVEILGRLGALFTEHKPSLVLAVGDTTTVFAAALAARKTGAAFGHVESGLRAFSRELPEEEHRICADALADLLFAPTRIAVENLTREQVNGTILLTGNPILDALRSHPPVVPADEMRAGVLVTLHRQETVDDAEKLAQVLAALDQLGHQHDVIWPVHPRTVAKVREAGLAFPKTITICEPLGHGEFLAKLASVRLVVTDSGGVQEEAAILGTPCVTVRNNTERPETIAEGVGLLAEIDTAAILAAIAEIVRDWKTFARPAPHLYGDGRAGDKIAHACAEWLATRADAGAALRRTAT
ncbi:MAG TPA: UDP-N-acetylglucosamine 2-epimerase (non-hydrolyzing) [Kofleriaceae bacterium]|nr:UDP-N-acetylglucosamine 2-epimerase (non-hydrolyzing) [Kofleriaceae bacterium]